MKKSFLLLALICIAIASCSKLERNEKKYLEGMQNEDYEASVNAVKEFCNWLETDKATMNYDFKLMREKIGLKAITSPDSVLRCYSWVSNRSEYGESYTNVAQWCIGESFIAYSGPIDYLLVGRKADIKHQETLAHSIDTIFEVKMANHPVYLIVQSYVNRDGKRRAYVTSTHIPGVQLQIMPFFFDGTEMAGNNVDNVRQSTLYAVDNAYWLAVSLKNKQRLAQEFLNLVKKLDDDVHKMINEGVATRADGLKVDVAVNNAEMTLTQVENGVSLAKMLLCQLCGLPLNGNQPLADDESSELSGIFIDNVNVSDSTYSSRPEVRMLQNTVELSQQATKLVQAVYKPHVALTGGFTFSNPNVFNGFDKWFDGVWNIGVLVHIPIWNWGEARYRYDATRAATRIAQMELSDIQEKISLQVEQSKFKVAEAQKRVVTARKNLSSADENLRCANVGFKEGVMTVTDVMAAQTAWQKAQTQKLDAEIDLRLAKLSLQKALGNI
jgi:hypothetical protein